MIIHDCIALSRVSVPVARFPGSGGILYYLTGGMPGRAVYAAIQASGGLLTIDGFVRLTIDGLIVNYGRVA